jgi:hypothetical protein
MTVLLTSFKRFHANTSSKRIPGYSIAVTQPDWQPELPMLHLFDIRDPNNGGAWTKVRDFVDESGDDLGAVKRYHEHLLDMYQRRYTYEQSLGQLGTQIAELIPMFRHDVALCCWCPYTKAAKSQIERFGTFVCHSMVVETFLRRGGLKVVRDKDREKQMVTL